ncbi:hypothetical protein KR200_009853, partial [Drosophila serrata]
QVNMWKLEIFALLGLLIFFTTSKCWTPKKCQANETFQECPSACQISCQIPTNKLCTQECGYPCVCKPGYIMDKSISSCVLLSDCP